MKAVVVNEFGGPEVLSLEKRNKPRCKKDEIQVEVKAVGLNQLDRRMREGTAGDSFAAEPPFVPGWDFAGVVSNVGKDVSRFKKGQKVFGMRQPKDFKLGTYSEFITVRESQAAHKPVNLSFAAAASIPTPALAAWQAVRERSHAGGGMRVLVHGCTGGVGAFAVQFAHLAGAWVIGTTSDANADAALDLGADEVIDYQSQEFDQVLAVRYPQGIDVVVDTIGGQVLARSLPLLKASGQAVTLADPGAAAMSEEGAHQPVYFRVESDGSQLERVAALFDENLLTTTIAATFSLEDVRLAHEMLDSQPGRGRIVLTLD
ncbi:MAG: NADP-dependent oxidoreductase [Gammaproteobacteria bacterium]|nr:NADP-dependent oxidoreductase [Gammaproteobacteria bacterium]